MCMGKNAPVCVFVLRLYVRRCPHRMRPYMYTRAHVQITQAAASEYDNTHQQGGISKAEAADLEASWQQQVSNWEELREVFVYMCVCVCMVWVVCASTLADKFHHLMDHRPTPFYPPTYLLTRLGI